MFYNEMDSDDEKMYNIQETIMNIVYNNDIKMLKKYLKDNKPDLNFHMEDGSPLYLAVKNNNHDMIKLLVNNGANINFPVFYLNHVLTMPVRDNNIKMVKFLIDLGADVNYNKDSESSPLLNAILASNYSMVRFLIKKGADINQEFTRAEVFIKEYKTDDIAPHYALEIAIANKDINMINLLIKKGVDIYANDFRNMIRYKFYDIAKKILKHNIIEFDGYDELERLFSQYKLNDNIYEIVEIIIRDYNINVNYYDDNYELLLNILLKNHINDNQDIVIKFIELLIDYGADIDIKQPNKLSPLEYSIQYAKPKLKSYLIKIRKDMIKKIFLQKTDLPKDIINEILESTYGN